MASVYIRRVCMPRTVRLFTIDFQNRGRVWLVLEGPPPHTFLTKSMQFPRNFSTPHEGVRAVLRLV